MTEQKHFHLEYDEQTEEWLVIDDRPHASDRIYGTYSEYSDAEREMIEAQDAEEERIKAQASEDEDESYEVIVRGDDNEVFYFPEGVEYESEMEPEYYRAPDWLPK